MKIIKPVFAAFKRFMGFEPQSPFRPTEPAGQSRAGPQMAGADGALAPAAGRFANLVRRYRNPFSAGRRPDDLNVQ